jgi:hypothetical protein
VESKLRHSHAVQKLEIDGSDPSEANCTPTTASDSQRGERALADLLFVMYMVSGHPGRGA